MSIIIQRLKKPYLLIDAETTQVLFGADTLQDAQYTRVTVFEHIELIHIVYNIGIVQPSIKIPAH